MSRVLPSSFCTLAAIVCTHIENDPLDRLSVENACERWRAPTTTTKRNGTRNGMVHTLPFSWFRLCLPLFAWGKRVCLLSARVYICYGTYVFHTFTAFVKLSSLGIVVVITAAFAPFSQPALNASILLLDHVLFRLFSSLSLSHTIHLSCIWYITIEFTLENTLASDYATILLSLLLLLFSFSFLPF